MILCALCGRNTIRKTVGLCTRCSAGVRYGSLTYTPEPKPGKRKRMNKPLSHEARLKLKLKQYGLTCAAYWAMLEKQGGLCAICCVDFAQPGIVKCIDHNHTTGEVRGILCGHCNTGIGFARESVDVLSSMIKYLTR